MQDDQQPGQVIIPHGNGDTPTEQPSAGPSATLPLVQQTPTPPTSQPSVPPAQETSVPLPQPVLASSPTQPEAATVAPEGSSDEAGGWAFRREDGSAVAHNEPLPENLSWAASEFVAHDKGVSWYGALFLGGGVAATLIYLLTKDKITTGIIVFAVLAFGVFASRKPHSEQYSLSADGLQVGQKAYFFHDFKTFSVVDEGGAASIVFMPLKRFMPALTIYVTSDVEDKVVDFLSVYLPLSEHKADAVDNLLRRIHF